MGKPIKNCDGMNMKMEQQFDYLIQLIYLVVYPNPISKNFPQSTLCIIQH